MLARPASDGLNKRDMITRKLDKPRGILHAPAAAATAEQHWRYWPSPDLAPFVEHYWTVEWNLHEPQVRETLPHPSMHIILEDDLAQVAGVFTKKFTRTLAGTGRVFSVKFRPGGFRPFVATPVRVFSDRVLALQDVFGIAAAGLAQRVLAHADHQAAIALIESFLRACDPQPDPVIELVGRICERIASDRAITKMEQIVGEFGIATRKLQRLFNDYVGVSPKWVIQRYRLHELVERLHATAPIDWAVTAIDLGYADQAHLIRDFKKFVGATPAGYARTVAAPKS
jgi:AraC-like DNA-binding protein